MTNEVPSSAQEYAGNQSAETNNSHPTSENASLPARRRSSLPALLKKCFSFPVLMGSLLVAAVVGNLYLGLKAAASAPTSSASYCIFEGDTWWHITAGEHILATHTVPTSDIYSFTSPGSPVIAEQWLGEVVLGASALLGGLRGMAALDILLAAGIILLLYAYANVKARNAKAAFASCALMLPLIIIFLDLRPQLLGDIFLLITLIALESFRQGRLKTLWFLPALFLLWVNVHGTFAMGFAIVGLYWVGGAVNLRLGTVHSQPWSSTERRHLGIVSLLSVLAATITPYGTRLFSFPLEMALFYRLNMATYQEWKPPDFHGSFGGYFLIVLLLILVMHLIARMQYRLEEIGLLLLAVYGACVHTRLIVFFVMIAAGVIAQVFARYVPGYEPHKDKPLLNAALVALIAAGAVAFFPSRTELRQVVRHGFPEGAVTYLRTHPSVRPVFNKEFWGSYLARELGPERKIFIDGRPDPYEASGVLSDYLQIMNVAPSTPFLLRKYGVNACLIEPQSPLAVFLARLPGWKLAYTGHLSVIFVRRREVPSDRSFRSAVGS